MPDFTLDSLTAEVSRRMFRESLAPSAFLFLSDTITDSDGARDVLAALWQYPDADSIVLVSVGLDPLSSAGVYRSDGPNVRSGIGQPLPAGGGYIYLYTMSDVRSFRIQAAAAGSILLRATAYRAANG